MFKDFEKIPRLLNTPMVVTEKIDGTNAQVFIEHKALIDPLDDENNNMAIGETQDFVIWAGSRSRWIVPGADNFGFASWVKNNLEELSKLGPGRHYGEWWGNGIQRGYGIKEKRFSLFNISKWFDETVRPKCCHVVPILYEGVFSEEVILRLKRELQEHGSFASPFMNPEGVIIYLPKANHLFKSTFENDDQSKWTKG